MRTSPDRQSHIHHLMLNETHAHLSPRLQHLVVAGRWFVPMGGHELGPHALNFAVSFVPQLFSQEEAV